MNAKPMNSFVALAALAALGVGGYGLYTLGVAKGRATPSAVVAPTATAPQVAASGAPPAGVVAAEDDMPSGQSVAEGEAATRRHMQTGVKAGMVDPVNGRKVLYYHDPMSPQARFDQPGKSPFMDMMLVPVYAGEGDGGSVQVSARMQQNLGLRTAEVVSGRLASSLNAVGTIAFNERDQAVVQSRTGGFVERLHVRATQDRVAQGQPLVDLYLPEWVAAQQELLSLRQLKASDGERLLDAARQRMRLLGMSDAQIQAVERTGQVQARTTLVAPLSGVVVEMQVREGMTLMPGAKLFRIKAQGSVWAEAEVSEGQLAQLRPGMPVIATSAALPSQRFSGQVQSLLPSVDVNTRTRKARLQLANPHGALIPGMSVAMAFEVQPRANALLVPTDAVIQTGERAVVMVAGDKGTFRPVTVVTGAESQGQTEVLRGLQPGLKVVVSSQFLIDSEASLKGLETRLQGAPGGAVAEPTVMPAPSAARSGTTAAAQGHVHGHTQEGNRP